MTEQTVMLGKRKFVLLPERDFRRLQARAEKGAAQIKRRSKSVAKPQRTLEQMDAWMNDHWDAITAKARRNTKRLTGREVL